MDSFIYFFTLSVKKKKRQNGKQPGVSEVNYKFYFTYHDKIYGNHNLMNINFILKNKRLLFEECYYYKNSFQNCIILYLNKSNNIK